MQASCQCGAITFTTPLARPKAIYICHCNECRHQSSSAFGVSACFPAFTLALEGDSTGIMGRYVRTTQKGHLLECFFCTACGCRLYHRVEGQELMQVKGGCLDELDLTDAVHIWAKEAKVAIPLDAKRFQEEPETD